jgi:hypothetical protein
VAVWRGSLACAPYEYGEATDCGPQETGHALQHHLEVDLKTALDASFNGVDLRSGDTSKLTFNETGMSILNIPGQPLRSGSLSRDLEHRRLQGQRHRRRRPRWLQRHASLAGFFVRFEPVDRADPSGFPATCAGSGSFYFHRRKKIATNSVKRKIFSAILRSREPMPGMVIEIWIFAGLPPHLVTFANHI